jgi:hypothetical protein
MATRGGETDLHGAQLLDGCLTSCQAGFMLHDDVLQLGHLQRTRGMGAGM